MKTNDKKPDRAPEEKELLRRYWKANLLILGGLLTIWAGLSLGCAILWVDFFNQWRLPGTGYPLGFWFAHQGSIIGFVLIILAYCLSMNRLDDRHHQDLAKTQAP